MSSGFDPYHKWLGIPPQEQPPHHDRLLGVALFEVDTDVIDAAANQRMSYLQAMAAGEHVRHSQRLLNEIAAARRCLLNPQTRAEYDTRLQRDEVVNPPLESGLSSLVAVDTRSAPSRPAAAPRRRPSTGKPAAETTAVPETEPAAAGRLTPARLATIISISAVTLTIALVLIFRSPADSAIFRVVWKINERQGACLLMDQSILIDDTHPPKPAETLVFRVPVGQHVFHFERDGCRAIKVSLQVRTTGIARDHTQLEAAINVRQSFNREHTDDAT